MAVYKDKQRGTWFCQIQYSVDGVRKQKTKRGFQTKRDAMNYESEFRLSDKPINNIRLESLFHDYLLARESNSETKKDIERKYDVFLSNYSKDRVDSFTPKKILAIVEKIRSSNYSKSYKNKSLSYVKSMLKFAKLNYDINTKYDLIKKIPKSSSDKSNFETWNDEEFNQFIKYVDNPVYKCFFTLLFRTGLRRGEALAIEYTDLNGNNLSVTKAYRRELGNLKTVSSLRTIMIDSDTLKMLDSIKQPNGRLFFFDNHYLSLTTIQRYFDAAILKSGVKRIRIHDLRHSHATNLINKGANIVAVSRRLGHSNIQMTIDTYTNVLEETELKLIDMIL